MIRLIRLIIAGDEVNETGLILAGTAAATFPEGLDLLVPVPNKSLYMGISMKLGTCRN